jgi:hypothetical protein
MRVAVHHLETLGRIVGQLEQAGPHQVTLLLGAFADDHRHRDPLDPFLDHHLGRTGDDVWDEETGMSLIGFGERALIVGLEPVVQFHFSAFDQLVDHALHIGAGGELPQHADHPLHGLQVGAQRLVGAGILDLDRNLAAVGPHRLVHLADAGRRDCGVVEGPEPFAPLGAQLPVEHPVHLGGGQWRSLPLQFGQRFAVRLAVLLGDGGLHHRQRLTDLHRAALELPENGEQLLGRLVHQLGADLVLRLAGQPFAEAQRCPAGHACTKARDLGVARGPTPLDLTHKTIIHDIAEHPAATCLRTLSAGAARVP